MRKTKLLAVILCLVLVLSLFAGCQSSGMDATQGTNPSTEPTQQTEATVPSDDVTEPSGEATEPSSEATEPTEATYPRTIESFKSYLTPYMTYGEAKALFGRNDEDTSDSKKRTEAIWFLEDGYAVLVVFYPTEIRTWEEYSSTIPHDALNENWAHYFAEWRNQMEAHSAACYKRQYDGGVVDVWFEHPNPWMTEE